MLPEPTFDRSAVAPAVPLTWDQVLYLPDGKLDILTLPVEPPFPEFEFKGYDNSEDRFKVAAWFVKRGAEGAGARRPNKGGGQGVDKLWQAHLQTAEDISAEAADKFKKRHTDAYVPKDTRQTE